MTCLIVYPKKSGRAWPQLHKTFGPFTPNHPHEPQDTTLRNSSHPFTNNEKGQPSDTLSYTWKPTQAQPIGETGPSTAGTATAGPPSCHPSSRHGRPPLPPGKAQDPTRLTDPVTPYHSPVGGQEEPTISPWDWGCPKGKRRCLGQSDVVPETGLKSPPLLSSPPAPPWPAPR